MESGLSSSSARSLKLPPAAHSNGTEARSSSGGDDRAAALPASKQPSNDSLPRVRVVAGRRARSPDPAAPALPAASLPAAAAAGQAGGRGAGVALIGSRLPPASSSRAAPLASTAGRLQMPQPPPAAAAAAADAPGGDDASNDAFSASQQRLLQLLGGDSRRLAALERAAGVRIMALPFAVARAADGSLFEVATGHVQLMMLQRHLAALGVELTPEEEEQLTTAADTGSGRSGLQLASMLRLGGSARASFTAASSCTGALTCNTPPSGARRSAAQLLHASSGISVGPAAAAAAAAAVACGLKSALHVRGPAASGARAAARHSAAGGKRVSMLGAGAAARRSMVGAAMDAHLAADAAQDAACQLPLDEVVLAHMAQLDLLVDALRQQLADDAAAAKAAKAAAAASSAAAAATGLCLAAGSSRWRQRTRHAQQQHVQAQPQQERQQERQCAPGGGAGGVGARWSGVRSLVQLNVDNWQQQRVAAARMSSRLVPPPSWQDVIMLGDLYIKRRSSQGAAVYEARCAELGLLPQSQVLQQLDAPAANMAHCKVGAAGAPALAAALAANSVISSLDLRDNNLDGKATALILQALATATAARLTARAKQHNVSFARESVAAISAERTAAGLPVGRPSREEHPQHYLAAPPHHQAPQQPRAKSMSMRWGGHEAGADAPGGGALLHAGYSTTPASPAHTAAAGQHAGAPWGEHQQQQQQQQPWLLESSIARPDAVFLPLDQISGGEGCGSAGGPQLPYCHSGSRGVLRAGGSDGGAGQAAAAASSGARLSRPGFGSDPGARAEAPAPPAGMLASADAGDDGADEWGGEEGEVRWGCASSTWPCGGTPAAAAACVGHGANGSGAAGSASSSPAIYSAMSQLDLSQNPLGASGAKAVAQLLDPSLHPSQFLVALQLGQCNLGEAGGLAIAAALKAGNLKLRVLGLAHNGLRCKSASALGEVLECGHTLRELDLGYNQIKAEGARGLARGLAANATLARLCLCWNGLEDGGGGALGEMLAFNMGLKHLDLNHCRLGPEACLLLGEGLRGNVVLEVLLLSGNERIGEDGARHLMAALAANRRLHFLGLNGANLTSAVRDLSASGPGAGSSAAGGGGHSSTGCAASDFNPAAPDGSYRLDLAVASERVVAVALVELDRAGGEARADDAMRGITLDGKAIPSARKAGWPAQLPTRGTLTCTFSSAAVRRSLGVMEGSKLATLLRQLRMPSMADRERLELAGSIIRTFSIGAERAAAAALLFARAADTAADLASLTGALTAHDLLGYRQALGWYTGCRWSAPTGHYELNLALPAHAAIAARLKDESLSGPEGPSWVNLLFDAASCCYKFPEGRGPPEAWRAAIPSSGTASFDYVSTYPPGVQPQTSVWGLPRLPKGGAAAAPGTRGAAGAGGSAASTASAASISSSSVGGAPQAAAAKGAAAAGAAPEGGQACLKPLTDEQLAAVLQEHVGIQLLLPAADAPAAGSEQSQDGCVAASAPAGRRPLSGGAAADAAVVALRQAIALGLLLLCSQVQQLVEAFTTSPHRVEVAVMCWPVTLDRDEAFWTVLYTLQGLEQSCVLQRLGPARLFNVAHASCHWVLDLSHPGHEEVARKLVALASGPGGGGGSGRDKGDEHALPNWWNLRLRGVRKTVNENANLWGMLTAESAQQILEFDFLGPDAWTALGRRAEEVAGLPPGDRLELRSRQAARLEVLRHKQLHPYYGDCGASCQQPQQQWATYDSLMSPQLSKAPWAAAWDRLLRIVLRLELRSGSSSRGRSALQQAFSEAAASQQMRAAAPARPALVLPAAAAGSDGGSMMPAPAPPARPQLCITASELAGLLRAWGYSKPEVAHYLQGMQARLQAQAADCAAAAGDTAGGDGGGRESSAGSCSDSDGDPQPGSPGRALALQPHSSGSGAPSASSSVRTLPPAAKVVGSKQGGERTGAAGAVRQQRGGAVAPTPAAGSSESSRRSDASSSSSSSSQPPPAAAAGSGGSGGQGTAALCAQLEAHYGRGLTCDEFVALVMQEPPRSIKLTDALAAAAAIASSSGRGLQGGGKGRAKQG